MVKYEVVFSKQAVRDSKRLKESGLDKKAKQLIEILKENPFQNPPPYEKLLGDLKDYYSRRINIQCCCSPFLSLPCPRHLPKTAPMFCRITA